MKYLYFPGCSLKSTGKPYEESIMSIFRTLDVEVEELKDWNCCGATAYMAVDEQKSFTLCARNLALAVKQNGSGKDSPVNIIAPCSACYSLLLKTQHYIEENPDVGRVVKTALKEVGLESEGLHKKVRIRHPLDVLANDIGIERVKEKVKRPLKGLKVIPYYGCLLVRPYATFDDPYNPTSMDRLVQASGSRNRGLVFKDAVLRRNPFRHDSGRGSAAGLSPLERGQPEGRRPASHRLPPLPV